MTDKKSKTPTGFKKADGAKKRSDTAVKTQKSLSTTHVPKRIGKPKPKSTGG